MKLPTSKAYPIMLFHWLVALVLAMAPLAASAQCHADRSIRPIVPYAPGGAVDGFARPMAQQLSEQLVTSAGIRRE